MSSSPRSRPSSPASSQGAPWQSSGPSSRSRGANTARRNRRGHALRREGAARGNGRGRRARRPPRWEKEGDGLYAEVAAGVGDPGDETAIAALAELAGARVSSAADVRRLLEPWTKVPGERAGPREATGRGAPGGGQEGAERRGGDAHAEEHQAPPAAGAPPFLWGSLPVGPVLAGRLRGSGRPVPTAVQRAAFPVLTADARPPAERRRRGASPRRANVRLIVPFLAGRHAVPVRVWIESFARRLSFSSVTSFRSVL